MELNQVLLELKKLGTAQNRKIYIKHGAPNNLYGVSILNLKNLKKIINKDHDLAIKLWESTIMDARCLAAMIADPNLLKIQEARKWIKESQYYVQLDLLITHLIYKTTYAQQLMEDYIRSEDEWEGRAGWILLTQFALYNPMLPDAYFITYLECIRTNVNRKKNRTKEAMNHALIAIGCRNHNLENISIAVSKEIGPVYIDHGSTACKTPNAEEYIKKTRKRVREKNGEYSI